MVTSSCEEKSEPDTPLRSRQDNPAPRSPLGFKTEREYRPASGCHTSAAVLSGADIAPNAASTAHAAPAAAQSFPTSLSKRS